MEPVETGDPDASLVVAVARGDRAALAELYDRYAGLLMAVGLRILKDRREAEDLLHDVFLEVWRSAADYDPVRGRVRTWLAIRMRSRALDRQKSARISRNVGDDSVIERLVSEQVTDAGPDHARVRSALTSLPVEQRQVVELAYFEGLSCTEIAAKASVPVGTVKSRMAAAMGKLRSSLQGEPEKS